MSAVFNIARKKKVESEPEDLSKAFYFTSQEPFAVGLNDTSTKTWNAKLEYSFDNHSWTTFEPSTVAACTNVNGGKIFFRGTLNTTLSGDHADDDNDDYAFFELTGNEIACRGDLTALLNYMLLEDNGSTMALTPLMEDYCLYHLFKNCTSLVEASIIIPDFIRGKQCCESMFAGCSNLRNAPTINIRRANNSCFTSMFEGCTALTAAPTLNITALDSMCFAAMFKDCTSLVSAPSLPVTSLAYGCYIAMFDGCSSLVNAPILPATELAYACYNQMFQGCTSLVNAPALPATIAAEACYSAMFNGCTSLVNSPKINLIEGAPSCCNQMFMNCSALESVSALFPLTAYQYSYFSMFKNCTSLEILPAISATIYYPYSCVSMFEGCTSLEVYTANNAEHSARFSLPYTLNKYENACGNSSSFANIFKNCQTDIVTMQAETNYYTRSVHTENRSLIAQDQTNMFEFVRLGGTFTLKVHGATVKTTDENTEVSRSWDGDLYYKVVNSDQSDSDVEWTLIDIPTAESIEEEQTVMIESADTLCGRILLKGRNNHRVSDLLTKKPVFEFSVGSGADEIVCRGNTEVLLDADTVLDGSHPSLAENGFAYMFASNYRIRSAPALLSISLSDSCYKKMFYNCGNLKKVPALPAASLATSCCESMFEGCTGLQIPPALPATTLAERCYYSMFYNCYALTAIMALPATYLSTRCYTSMFAAVMDTETILISAENTADRSVEWRLPFYSSDTATMENSVSLRYMFSKRGSMSEPSLNTTYYAPAVVLPDGSLVTS